MARSTSSRRSTASRRIRSAPSQKPGISESGVRTRPRGYPKPLGPGKGLPITLDGRYVLATSATFRVEEKPVSVSGDSYFITDCHGQVVFDVGGKLFSLHESKTLRDINGATLLNLREKILSARATMTISDAAGKPLLTLHKSSWIQLTKRAVHGFLGAKTSGVPDLVISGDTSAERFVIRDNKSNEVARIVRAKTPNRTLISGSTPDCFTIHINAGYDFAILVLCVVCIDEMWST